MTAVQLLAMCSRELPDRWTASQTNSARTGAILTLLSRLASEIQSHVLFSRDRCLLYLAVWGAFSTRPCSAFRTSNHPAEKD